MQIFLVIAKRGLAVDMIYVATGRLGDGVAGGGIPLHRRGETGIDIGRAFRYQTNLLPLLINVTGFPCLRRLSMKAVVSSVW